MTPKAVLFDCDGVIVDSEPLTNELLQANLSRYGLNMSLQGIADMFVGGTMKSVGELATTMGASIPDDWLDGISKEIYHTLRQGTPLIADIVQVFDRLDSAGIVYAVGSNGPVEKMAITIGQYPELMDRLSDRLFSGQSHAAPKPLPDLYLYAANFLNVAPEDCFVIDDSPAGCRAAVAANIPCYGFAEHGDGSRLQAVGATVFHSMLELPKLLNLPE